MKSDEALYYAYLDGDDEALEELVARYRESLTLFLVSLVKNMEDAEDLMMEAFAVLLSSDKTFCGKSTFKTWLFAIGRNKAVSFIRKEHRHREILKDDYRLPETKSAELVLLQKERNMTLYSALHTLKDDYQTAIYLSYFADMSHADIGKVMKKTPKQITDLLYNGKKALRKVLSIEGDVL